MIPCRRQDISIDLKFCRLLVSLINVVNTIIKAVHKTSQTTLRFSSGLSYVNPGVHYLVIRGHLKTHRKRGHAEARCIREVVTCQDGG